MCMLYFSDTSTSIGLIIKNLEFLTNFSSAASCLHYYEINLLQFSQIEFELSAKINRSFSLWRVYLGVFHGSQFSVSRANLHNTHLLLYFSLLECPT